MNVLFVLYSLPNLVESSMYSDLVNEFRKNGHNIYPIAPSRSLTSKSFLSIENSTEVLRVKTIDVFSKNLIKKGLANILLPVQFKKAFKKYWKDISYDAIIVATPSVMFADFVFYLKQKSKAKVYLMQKDIFPQNAVDLGMMTNNSFLYKYFKRKEVKLLRTADFIGCTSPANITYLLKNNNFLLTKNLHLLYNSSNILHIKPDLSKFNQLGLEKKFVVVFGGNMGKPQQLENVLYLAKKCTVYDDVVFLIIGSGTQAEYLKTTSKRCNLNNLIFINPLRRDEYFSLIAACNVGLISLHQDFTVPNTPMKLNDYLNASLPVLASIDRNNDLGVILLENKMGLYAFADSPNELFNRFEELYSDREKCKEYGRNGYLFCKENMSTSVSYKTITSYLS